MGSVKASNSGICLWAGCQQLKRKGVTQVCLASSSGFLLQVRTIVREVDNQHSLEEVEWTVHLLLRDRLPAISHLDLDEYQSYFPRQSTLQCPPRKL